MPRPPKLRPVWPNAGIAAAYRRKLRALVIEMAEDYEAAIEEQWEEKPPAMAADATPARGFEQELRRLGDHWRGRIDEAAPKLAKWFRQKTWQRSDAALRKILRDAGMTVRYQMTPGMRDVADAVVAENVGLIKSIGAQYHAEVQGLVMRSVAAGRDLSTLSRELRARYGVTQRRAALISRDQNNKATAQLRRVRELDLGLEEGIWLHSHAGKEPRPTHLKNHGRKFDVRAGWYDPDPRVRRRILPGELINCRCTWRPIVKGFS